MTELSSTAISQFIEEGFLRLDHAFPREVAEEGRELLWRATGCEPGNPATWTQAVIRLGYQGQEPFRRAVNTPRLHAAFDQLVGPARWQPRADLGTFPIRFPSPDAPGDDGWHADASFPGEDPSSFFSWAGRPVAFATGEAGTVYLCHPFLVHAAQPHRGTQPRFMAQPPLHPAQPFLLHREDGAYSPVEIAIRLGLGLERPPHERRGAQ